MKSKWLAGLLVLVHVFAQEWQQALPGYQYQFPRDHFSHPEYQTEWWYYTGNLHTADGRRFGFELTFFRVGLHLPKHTAEESDGVWRPDQIYLAHLALSDIDGRRFFHTARLNRSGPGLAGAGWDQQRYWNGNWQVRWLSLRTADQQLQAVDEKFTLTLNLHSAKPPVVNGQDGISQKGPKAGEASHYISFSRLIARGVLVAEGKPYQVEGLAWMDHEFFTEERDSSLAGWDWFAIQLENNEELMLYRLRLRSGDVSPYSSGTFVDAGGQAHFLTAADFSLQAEDTWKSPSSHAPYPVRWGISVPCLQAILTETTPLQNQELFGQGALTPSYWEGAVTYQGTLHSHTVKGVGYLEMTGYDKQVWLAAH